MKNTLFALFIVPFILLGAGACADTHTRVLQGIYTLGQTVNVQQSVAEAIIRSGTLSATRVQALKALEHAVGDETQALLTKAIDSQNGKDVSVTSTDLDNARKDLGVLKSFISILKADPKTAQVANDAAAKAAQ